MAKFKPILSFSEIARRSGLSLATISKIYSGKGVNHRRPSLDAAQKIAKAQDITVDQLYRDLNRLRSKAKDRRREKVLS